MGFSTWRLPHVSSELTSELTSELFSVLHRGVELVETYTLTLREDVTLHRLNEVRSLEAIFEPKSSDIKRVDLKVILMNDLVVPRRAGAIITTIRTAHLSVTREPIAVVIDTANPVRDFAGRLALGYNLLALSTRRELAHISGDVREEPVIEVHAWEARRDRLAFLIDVICL